MLYRILLATVVDDVGLAFAIEKGTDSEILTLVRAKEAAQAAIAEATFRRDLAAAQAAAEIPSEPDTVGGTTMSETPGSADTSAAPTAPPSRGVAGTRMATRRGRRKTARA